MPGGYRQGEVRAQEAQQVNAAWGKGYLGLFPVIISVPSSVQPWGSGLGPVCRGSAAVRSMAGLACTCMWGAAKVKRLRRHWQLLVMTGAPVHDLNWCEILVAGVAPLHFLTGVTLRVALRP